jgi:hypothetical protein
VVELTGRTEVIPGILTPPPPATAAACHVSQWGNCYVIVMASATPRLPAPGRKVGARLETE